MRFSTMLPKTFVVTLLLSLAGADGDLAVYGSWPDQETSETSAVPLRLNINSLKAAGGPAWDLYIQSLQAMYDTDASEPLSFFQTAGIHGAPYVEWGSTGKAAPGNEGLGYCPHGDLLFLPWHRAYLVRFEQTMTDHAKRIAASYPDAVRQSYLQAADNLRLPYWDWAAEPSLPDALLPTTVKITMASSPNGTLHEAEVHNPLSNYRFPQGASTSDFGSFSSLKTMERCTSRAESFPGTPNGAMPQHQYKQAVYSSFTRATTFEEFGTTSKSAWSIEWPHNGIHHDAACKGQFFDARTSGFDMLFWLHHANMDRLWAHWQQIHPEEATLQTQYRGRPRWASARGATITKDSPLHPFLQDNGNMHTSETVKSIESFGYSYEGLEYWSKSPAEMRNASVALVNRLYGPNNGKLRRRGEPAVSTQYFATVSVDVAQLQRPCIIEVAMKGRGAGQMVIMEQPDDGVVKGGFALQHVMKTVMKPSEAYINKDDLFRKQISVNITKMDGTVIDPFTIPSLSVEVEEVHAKAAETITELPEMHLGRLFKGLGKGLRGALEKEE